MPGPNTCTWRYLNGQWVYVGGTPPAGCKPPETRGGDEEPEEGQEETTMCPPSIG